MTASESDNFLTDGNIAGGSFKSVGIEINWQDKILGKDEEPTGALVETVIEAALQRLRFCQLVPCRKDSLAITKLEECLHWLNHQA